MARSLLHDFATIMNTMTARTISSKRIRQSLLIILGLGCGVLILMEMYGVHIFSSFNTGEGITSDPTESLSVAHDLVQWVKTTITSSASVRL